MRRVRLALFTRGRFSGVAGRRMRSLREHPACASARSAGVLELRQLLQRLLGGSRQLDLASRFVEHEALIRDSHPVAAEMEKASDLEHREENPIASDDDVLDRADLFVLIVHDTAPNQLTGAITIRNGTDIDNHELDTLRQHRQGGRGGQHGADKRRCEPSTRLYGSLWFGLAASLDMDFQTHCLSSLRLH